MSQAHSPAVSIGMPVFNGGSSLSAAIESLLQQSHSEFRLYISDNCSTDSTESICRAFAERDPRIVYTRQGQGISAVENFRYVLSRAECDYFLWAAADDVRSPDYLEANLRFLEQHPDYVASTSPTRFTDGSFNGIRMGDAALDGDVEQRFLGFFSAWHANARFYSLFRRDVISACAAKDGRFLGSDWAMMLRCLLVGKFGNSGTGWTVLGRHGVSNSTEIFAVSRNHWYERILPFYALSRTTLSLTRAFGPAARTRLLLALLRLNAAAFVRQIRLGLRSIARSLRPDNAVPASGQGRNPE